MTTSPYHKEWARKNPDKCRMYQRKQKFKPSQRLSGYRTAAKKRGHDFTVSDDVFLTLVVSPCHYCGMAPNPTVGVDRVDNSVGYVEGNLVPCCKFCNYAKNTASVEEFTAWLDQVARFRNEKKEG